MIRDRKVRDDFMVEPERYEFRALPIHQFSLGRRDFVKLFGAGIVVFAVVKSAAAQETASGPKAFHNEELPTEIGAWLHISEDGTVTGFVGKAEMGQNIRTSLSQTIADELSVSLENVRLVLGDTALTPFDAGTFGSRTTPTMTPQLRSVAAAARDILVRKAAKQWNVPAEKLVTEKGKVLERGGTRSLTYGELAHEDLFAQHLPANDPVKHPAALDIAGKALPKVDGRSFVTGAHQYSSDLRPPGMLYGKVLRPPSFGATVTSYDDAEAKALKDVVLVRDGDFIGAAASTAVSYTHLTLPTICSV